MPAKIITAEEFERKTGQPPQQDDLQRVNCAQAGLIGHWHCGWCDKHDLPRFQCGDFVKRREAQDAH